jgi:hypothetical protein
MKESVKKYNDINLSCIPCKLDKSPDVKGTWLKAFSIEDFETAKAIGIKCGKESGNLECIDIDNHQGTANQNLKEFIEQIKALYEKYNFPIERTQNGGYHIIYKCLLIEGNQKLAQVPILDKNNKWKPDAIFETRGEGGYFCAYPSPGYVVVKNDIFKIPIISIEDRSFILSVCRSFNTWYEPIKSEFEQTDKPGDLYNKTPEAITEMIQTLEAKGWKQRNNYQWSRPDKKDGISATLGKVAPNCFYVFSSNAYPFEPMKGYSPFQVKALLEYNGDFKECAKYISNRYGLNRKTQNNTKVPPEAKQLNHDDKIIILKKHWIDTSIEMEKPPVVLYISDTEGLKVTRKRLFTLGNFSAIIGKAKSRKTWNLTLLTSAMVSNANVYFKFFANLPNDKKQVLYFDTEQSDYDSANTMKRIERLSRCNTDHFAGFNLRDLAPLERCDFIENALSFFPSIGFVAIDGIVDLAVNEEYSEAVRVSGLLLRWTKQYNCHIATVIHQNKNDNFATGHLGSSIMKKAEIVISVAKDKGSASESIVSCDYSRGIDFSDYSFFINDNGLPELSQHTELEAQVDKWYE